MAEQFDGRAVVAVVAEHLGVSPEKVWEVAGEYQAFLRPMLATSKAEASHALKCWTRVRRATKEARAAIEALPDGEVVWLALQLGERAKRAFEPTAFSNLQRTLEAASRVTEQQEQDWQSEIAEYWTSKSENPRGRGPNWTARYIALMVARVYIRLSGRRLSCSGRGGVPTGRYGKVVAAALKAAGLKHVHWEAPARWAAAKALSEDDCLSD